LFIVLLSTSLIETHHTSVEAKMLEMAGQQKPDHVEVVMGEEEGSAMKLPLRWSSILTLQSTTRLGVAQQYLKNYTSSFMKQAQQLQAD
jgi:hypothetical protein